MRDKNPNYANLDDDQLANYLHKKFYSDIPFKDYAEAIGYQIPKNNSKVDDSESNSVHEHQIKLLDTLHPDWKEITKSEDFEKWTSRLSDEHRKMLSETWDAIELSEYIARYKKEKNIEASNLSDDYNYTASNNKENFEKREASDFDLHEFLKKFVAHMFLKLLFAIGIFQLLTIGVRRIDISSAHQQGRWLASWLVSGSVLMTSLTKLDYGDYANFFGFFTLQIVGAWLIGYVTGYAWFKLKAHPMQFNANNIACLEPVEVINDLNTRAKNLAISKNQKLIIFIASSVIVLMLAYPPHQVITANGVVYNMGYDWLLAPPQKGNITATVNVAMLLTQWTGVLAIGGMTLFLTKTSNRNN